MVKKKAYIKTVEIIIAIVLTTIFILVILPKGAERFGTERPTYLTKPESHPDFRSFAAANSGCFNSSQSPILTSLIERYLPRQYDYTLCIGTRATSLPDKDIQIDSVFFAGNISQTNFRTIRLYYWTR